MDVVLNCKVGLLFCHLAEVPLVDSHMAFTQKCWICDWALLFWYYEFYVLLFTTYPCFTLVLILVVI